MSYSFSIKAATKADAKAAVAAEFDQIVEYQPVHARDRDAVLATANAIIDLLADDETKDIGVSCNGYVSWTASGDEGQAPLSSVAISASANHVAR